MASSPEAPDPGSLRASDQDREQVAEALRAAAGDGRLSLEELDERLEAAYAAKTYADLEPITRDLPRAGAPPAAASAVAADAAVDRFGGEPTSSGAVAVLGGFERKGAWVVPADFTAVAVLGGGELDLREARFAEHTVAIHAFTIMGGISVIVPEDADVQVSGVGIMGAFGHEGTGTGRPGAPKIIVNGLAIMGGVDVVRKPPESEMVRRRHNARRQVHEARREIHEARRQVHEARRERLASRRMREL